MTYSNTDARLPNKVVFSETLLAALQNSKASRRSKPSVKPSLKPRPLRRHGS